MRDSIGQEYGVNCEMLDRPVHRAIPFIGAHTGGHQLPVSDELGDRLFCAPVHPCMPEEHNEYIAAATCDAADQVAREIR